MIYLVGEITTTLKTFLFFMIYLVGEITTTLKTWRGCDLVWQSNAVGLDANSRPL